MGELLPTLLPPLPPPAATTMNDLPNKILFKILSNVDDRSRRNAACVSRTWHTVIDEMIGRVTFVGRPCQVVLRDNARYTHKYVDIRAISEMGVNECYFGEVVDPSTTMTLLTYLFSSVRKVLYGDVQPPKFKYPHLVKTLHFDGPVPNQYFESILQDLVNLTKVELHMTALTCLHSSALQPLQWQSLKWLKIWGHTLIDGRFTAFHPTQQIAPNLHLILTNVFPSLTHFSIERPFDFHDERSLIQRVSSFLRSHPGLLEFRMCINLASNTDDTQEFEDQEEEFQVACRALNLKVVKLIVCNMRRARLASLLGFLEQQRTLERVTIISFPYPPQMVTSITHHNWSTLRTSVRWLPLTLTHLEIHGLPLLHADTQAILLDLPLLSNLCFTYVGNQGRFGVTVVTLSRVILARRINVVTIYRSICGEFQSIGIPNGDPSSAVFLTYWPREFLKIKLNETGYYENTHPPHSVSVYDDMDDDYL